MIGPELEPVAAEVRARMLRHLGLIPTGPVEAREGFLADLPPTIRSSDLALMRAAANSERDGQASVPPVVVTASPAPVAAVPVCAEPAVSVVVVTYGTGAVVIDALRSVAEAAGPSVEVIVVDQPHAARGDATYADLLLFSSGVRVVRAATNSGFGGGCELGALFARGEYVAFVNPDVVVPDHWLTPLIEHLEREPDAIVAPLLHNADGSLQEAGQVVHTDGATERITTFGDVVPEEPFETMYASAACWVMHRDVHERSGGFDPAYFPAYFEDVDFAYRARSLGHRTVVHPGVRVLHLDGCGTPEQPAPAHAQRELFASRWLSE